MERISLNKNALQIQFAKELPEYRPLMVLADGVAGLAVAVRFLRSSTPRPKQRSRACPGQ